MFVEIGWSSTLSNFSHAFALRLGICPDEYRRIVRVAEARPRLIDLRRYTDLAHVATDTGHCNEAHLVRRFKEQLGVTPGAYRP